MRKQESDCSELKDDYTNMTTGGKLKQKQFNKTTSAQYSNKIVLKRAT